MKYRIPEPGTTISGFADNKKKINPDRNNSITKGNFYSANNGFFTCTHVGFFQLYVHDFYSSSNVLFIQLLVFCQN
jgi:hypothetical protein